MLKGKKAGKLYSLENFHLVGLAVLYELVGDRAWAEFIKKTR